MNKRPRYRNRGLMSDENVDQALGWVKKLGASEEALNLHVFGEPLLHPRFHEIAWKFSCLTPITMSTNGVLLDEAWADGLATVPWAWISVSPWNLEAQAKAITLLHERGIRTMSPPGATHDWAGQSEGPKSLHLGNCPFLNYGRCVIRWDGAIAACCISDREEDVVGHVAEEPTKVFLRPYSICATCHHRG